jgi:acyl-CoA dehydrogenase
MDFNAIRRPFSFLQDNLGRQMPHAEPLAAENDWWENEGARISQTVDRSGTPWLRMFNESGRRIDQVLFPHAYDQILKRGYRSGVVWRAFEEKSLLFSCQLLYTVGFYDPGICCPYTLSLATALSLAKYGTSQLQERFLPPLLRRDDSVWQGATWMTEIKGGSDLGTNVEAVARPGAEHWSLTGDKYFASNVGADLAVIAARPAGAPANVRGLALFLLPKLRQNGELNYFVRRLKDKIATRSVPTGEVELRNSEAYLLGPADSGIYLILEVLNISRVANSVVSVALAQRAIADALAFAEQRIAFGQPIINHPLLRRQLEDRNTALRGAFALAWESVRLLDEVRSEQNPYSERYYLFRLVAHLAKYWTAEFAAQTAKWCMEVHGGLGVLSEFTAERWFREAMILAIWEGTSHRQILDGIEVMERKQAQRLLFARLAQCADREKLKEMRAQVESQLALPPAEKEADAENLFRSLAEFTARTLSSGHSD